MWSHHSGWFGFDPDREPLLSRRRERAAEERESMLDTVDFNAPDDVLGEVGLVLVVILGVVLAINAALIALHIT